MNKKPIASRVLHCQIAGKSEEVTVRLYPPWQEEDHFVCEYEISLAGRNERLGIIGLDSIHALQLAMFMVGSALQSMRGATNWRWNDEPYTGFPTSLDQPIIGLRS